MGAIFVEEESQQTTPQRSIYDVLCSAPKVDLDITRQRDVVRPCDLASMSND